MKRLLKMPILLSTLLFCLLAGCLSQAVPTPKPDSTGPPDSAITGTPESNSPTPTPPTETAVSDPTLAPIRLKVAVSPYLSYAPIYMAETLGYFKEQGLTIEISRITRSSDAIAALSQGQLDVAGLPISSALLNAFVRESGLKIVAAKERIIQQSCVYSGIVVRTGSPLAGSEAITADILKGLTYDVTPASTSGYILDTLLHKYGLSLNDVKLATMPNPAADLEGMQNGTVDVASMTEPWITQVRSAGAGDVWLGSSDLAPDNQLAIIAYGPTIIKNNPEAGERFMTAYLKAVRQFARGMDETTLSILEKGLELDRSLLKKMCAPYIPLDGQINMQSIINFGDWAAAKGYIDAPVTADMFWEPRYVEYANKVLGKP